MWKYERAVEVHASKQIVWQWWTNVEKWPQWDTDLSESAILGELAVGTQGRMKVADDALVSFVVSECIPEEKLAIEIALFGATLTYTYALSEDESGLKIIHGATIAGIFGFVWRMMLKNKIIKVLDSAQDAFALQVAEESARQEADAVRAAQAAVDAANPIIAPEVPAAKSEETAASTPVSKIASAGGDAVENELRSKDIRTQIEVAAQASIPEAKAADVAGAEEKPQGEVAASPSSEVALLELPKPLAESSEAGNTADTSTDKK